MKKILALVGNPNSGKTTLFNALTGESAHTGNFPGVTVEARLGTLQETGDTLIDLPGVYSLSAYSEEERVTRRVLLSGQVQGIVNVVDAANPARSLYLTLQLLELGLPVVIAFNMMDEVEAGGGFLDVPALSRALGAAACGIAASRRQGLSALSAAIRGMGAAPPCNCLVAGCC